MPSSNPLLAHVHDPAPILIAGAHDALSARIAQLSGFGGLWISSLGVSASMKALPDANLLTMTEMLQVTWNISGRVCIPLMVDAENGYGDANNARLSAVSFHRAGAAAICIEDNEFPKRNSFYDNHCGLVDAAAMQAKLEACRTATDESLMIVARTEAMIIGAGLAEALNRGYAYQSAGAHALVAHAHRWEDARAFARRWEGHIPLVVIPTQFPAVTPDELAGAGFRIIIYANQSLRAAITAMQGALRTLSRGGSAALESTIAPLSQIEELVGASEMLAAEPAVEHTGPEISTRS